MLCERCKTEIKNEKALKFKCVDCGNIMKKRNWHMNEGRCNDCRIEKYMKENPDAVWMA